MLSLSDKNLLVIDIETTGVNPFKHDALAVGLVPLNRALPQKQIFIAHESLEWNEFALKNFEKFQAEWLAAAIPPFAACQAIEEYIRQTFNGHAVTLIGHNIGFDIAFLRKIAFQGGRDELAGISHRAVDTHTLLYLLKIENRIPVEATTSGGALKHFGIDVPPWERHTALADARATRELVTCIFQEIVEATGAVPSWTKAGSVKPAH